MSDALRLDVGCGGRGSRQPGCIGIDLCPRPSGKTKAEYVRIDFVNDPLPWEHGTVDEIVCLHTIEHMTPDDGAILIMRGVELLKRGKTMTVTCPDLMRLCRAYVESDHAFLETKHLRGGKDIWPGAVPANRLNWAIHQDGHQWAYDMESLTLAAVHAIARTGHKATVVPLPDASKYNTRRGLEIGIVITKGDKR